MSESPCLCLTIDAETYCIAWPRYGPDDGTVLQFIIDTIPETDRTHHDALRILLQSMVEMDEVGTA